jgi:hypothetical protein
MFTVVPIKDIAVVVLKKAYMEVIVPLRGTTNAWLYGSFVGFEPLFVVKSIVLPVILAPENELPNPSIATVPVNPPAIVVTVIGAPEENGIIVDAPDAPVAPCAPVGPVAPVTP